MNKIRVLFLCALALPAYAANLAIIDSGLDYKHKDLAAKIWTNAEAQTVDADGKTYSGDTHGWNFAENNNQIIDYKYLGTFSSDCTKVFDIQAKILKGTATAEEKSWYQTKKQDLQFGKELRKFGNFVHGTHVGGIAAEKVETAKLIGLKLIPTESPIGRAQEALRRAREEMGEEAEEENRNGADNPMAKLILSMLAKRQVQLLTTVGKYVHAVKAEVANGSFGTSVPAVKPLVANLLKSLLGQEPTDEEAKAYSVYFVNEIVAAGKDFTQAAPDTLFVFAAGNDGTDNDASPVSPANIKTGNTLSVAATYENVALAGFSNYGSQMVDVAAPGVVVPSTIPGDQYLAMSGTSVAAPYVTNVAGLVKDANKTLNPSQIRQILMSTVDKKEFLKGKVASGGMVNRARAVLAAELSLRMSLPEAIARAQGMVADVPAAIHAFDGVSLSDIVAVPLPTLF